ncbi:MAG: invasion associated locus B family protein [Planktomarina sp.]|jgi:invasion protein IalB|nr:invasion associated locus B family protein [Planktomarina sp.]MDT2058298.1 invasion associated locus B family protein [Planktomarina sp.]MDT2073720.1 invasion associated locus B family protein [Planktomarina sp.]MDT2078533.1 invasion associated locus B family protein [Planktomarina sp.]|tara:strand:- start:648 stop:1268 length:621 start_codon:yes stop_codon:yes gene_type:complete
MPLKLKKKGFFVSLIKTIVLTLFLSLVSQNYASAQTVDNPTPTAEDYSTGKVVSDESNFGDYYNKGQFGDWTLRCEKTKDLKDPCHLFQLMLNVDGTPVAEFILNIIEPNGVIIAGATVITPLETLLTAELTIRIGENKAKIYPFSYCIKMGCVARIGLTEDDLTRYRAGIQATVTMVPSRAPNQPENLKLSLKGFTSGYKVLIEN